MKYQEILENLCIYDHRNPIFVKDYNRSFVEDTKSLEQRCLCLSCKSGKTKLALVMLEMVTCFSCRHFRDLDTGCFGSVYIMCTQYESDTKIEKDKPPTCDKWELSK